MLEVYSSKTCMPCKQFKAMLDKHSVEYRVVDIEQETEKAREAGIKGVPTTVDTKTGNRLVGNVSYDQLQELL